MGGRSGSFKHSGGKPSAGDIKEREKLKDTTHGWVEVKPGVTMPTTTTYDRWKHQKDREHEERFVDAHGYNPIKEFRTMTPKEIDKHAKKEQMRDPIGRRYYELKPQHPEWKNMLQGKSWVRKHDRYGQEAENLRKQGLASFQIIHRLKDFK